MPKADAVFEGGGVKGIALVGALQAFEEAHFEWQNVAGTSAGAITAALVAAGYTSYKIRDIMNERVDFRRFMDPGPLEWVPFAGRWLNLAFYRGMYRGDYFLTLMRQLLAEKLEKERVTFGDMIVPKEPEDSQEEYELKYKYRLRLVASDISSNEMLVLPNDAPRLGVAPDDLEVALAVRMSMSIPFFFRPVIYGEGEQAGSKHWIVDGGILSNFPIGLFDSAPGKKPSWPTLGFLLWEPGSEKPRYERIGGLTSMVPAMARTMSSAHDRKALRGTDLGRIVKIPTGRYTTTDFALRPEDRAWLHDSGYQAGKMFLSTWSFDQYVVQQMAVREAGAIGNEEQGTQATGRVG